MKTTGQIGPLMRANYSFRVAVSAGKGTFGALNH